MTNELRNCEQVAQEEAPKERTELYNIQIQIIIMCFLK